MNNINNSKSKVAAMTKGLLSFCMLGALSFMTSCSDTWDEHYDVAATGSDASIWETISTDEQLSNFAKVVKACGYDVPLNSSQVFTVFAPINSGFTSEQADEIINLYNSQKAAGMKEADNLAVKEFLRNHIALYNYSVNSSSNDSITMMNGKYLMLTPNTIGGKEFLSENKLLGNGILFTLKDKVDYTPNVFEYLRTDSDLDSLSAFLYSYNKYEFDAAQSVPGGIEDGKTVYLDSVKVLQNPMFNNIGRINSEDSTYWMVAPTNEVWKELVAEYRNYFNFDKSIPLRDSLQDYCAKLYLVAGAVFSRTVNTDKSIMDSAMSTYAVPYDRRKYVYGNSDLKYYQYDNPFAPGGVFYGTQNIACSNGQVMKTSDWNIDKYQTFLQTIIVEAEHSNSLKEVGSGTRDLNFVTVQSTNTDFYNKLSNNSYVEIMPTGSVNPSASFYIGGVLSNVGYDIYVVMAPALAGDTLARKSDRNPNKFRCMLRWNKEDATADSAYVDGTETAAKSSFYFDTKRDDTPTVDVVDTILVAKNWKLPTASYSNLSRVSLKLESRVSSTDVNKDIYQRTMRLDCIILKPHRESATENDDKE